MLDKATWTSQKKKKYPGIDKAELDRRWKQYQRTGQNKVKGQSTAMQDSSALTRVKRKDLSTFGPAELGAISGYVAQVLDPFSAAAQRRLCKGPSNFSLPTSVVSFQQSYQVTTDANGNFIIAATSNLQRAYGANNGPPGNPQGFQYGTSGVGFWTHVSDLASVPKYADWVDLFSNGRLVGMAQRYTPVGNAFNMQGSVVGFPLPCDVPFPTGGGGLNFAALATLESAMVGPATQPFTIVSRPMDERAHIFRLPQIDRLGPFNTAEYANCNADVAIALRYLQAFGVLTGPQYDQIMDVLDDSGWSNIFIAGTGLPPNTVVGTIDLVWIVEGVPLSRSFSAAQGAVESAMPAVLPSASQRLLAQVPVAVSEKPTSNFTDTLSAAVDSVRTVAGNLGIPFLPQVAGAVSGVLGLFKKKR